MSFDELIRRLSENAVHVEGTKWSIRDTFSALAEAGVMQSVIPVEYGGSALSSREQLEQYEQLSEACLTTAFILTQRNGACQRIVTSANEPLKQQLLPRLATGELFATVGISHLTTSRQHIKKPSVQITHDGDDLVLDGFVPWVTAADHADFIVTGGTFENGEQALVVLPRNETGVTVQDAVELMALTASQTAAVTLESVRIPADNMLHGPVHEVMKHGTGGGAGSLTTSMLAIGLCQRMLKVMAVQAEQRDSLRPSVDEFETQVRVLRTDLYEVADGTSASTTEEIRQQANSLALRLTQAALMMTKGAGFVRGHAVELAVREAMFFLVWSCPQPVVDGVLSTLIRRDSC